MHWLRLGKYSKLGKIDIDNTLVPNNSLEVDKYIKSLNIDYIKVNQYMKKYNESIAVFVFNNVIFKIDIGSEESKENDDNH